MSFDHNNPLSITWYYFAKNYLLSLYRLRPKISTRMKVTTPSEPTSDSEHEEETIEVEDDPDDSDYYYSDSDIEEEKESSEPKPRYLL